MRCRPRRRIRVPPRCPRAQPDRLDRHRRLVRSADRALNSTCGGTAPCACAYTIALDQRRGGHVLPRRRRRVHGDSGTFTLTVSGTIKNGQSCESPLAQSGALKCNTGYACTGTMGSRTCSPAMCSDGIDNDERRQDRLPERPGLHSPGDNDETNPATLPACCERHRRRHRRRNRLAERLRLLVGGGHERSVLRRRDRPDVEDHDEDGDRHHDGQGERSSPAVLAVGIVERKRRRRTRCSCRCRSTRSTIDTIGSSFDTMLYVRDAQCTSPDLACDDDGASPQSKITMTGVSAGGYSITVDGYSANNGTYTLNVQGTVAPARRAPRRCSRAVRAPCCCVRAARPAPARRRSASSVARQAARTRPDRRGLASQRGGARVHHALLGVVAVVVAEQVAEPVRREVEQLGVEARASPGGAPSRR